MRGFVAGILGVLDVARGFCTPFRFIYHTFISFRGFVFVSQYHNGGF